jgi:molybdopterin synthase catalytic subunit
MFEVWERPLELAPLLTAVSHSGAGAVDVFIGVVRDHNEGRAVSKLEYEAYPTMAVKQMERIAQEISSEIPGVRLAAVHRVGSLLVGDWAIVCVASAPHRSEAFAACRKLIDQIKALVPVWKREWGEQGPYWVGWQDARCDAHGHRHHGSE